MRILQRWRTSCACHANGCRARLPKSRASTLDFVLHASLPALLPARLFSPFLTFSSPPRPRQCATSACIHHLRLRAFEGVEQ